MVMYSVCCTSFVYRSCYIQNYVLFATLKSEVFPGFLLNICMIMPPTLKKLEGHIAFGLSVCLCVCASVNF